MGLKWILVAVAGGWIALSYYLPQLVEVGPRRTMVPMAWEHGIPFQPWWTLVYQSIFVVLPAFYFLQGKRREVLVMAGALMLTALVDGSCFILFPTAIDRPEMPGGLSGWLYEWLIVRPDKPANLIPSQHAAMAVIACLAGFRFPGQSWMGWAGLAWLGFLLYSTLAVKQHVFLDLPPGCLVGLLSFLAADRWMKKTSGWSHQIDRKYFQFI
jgi:hypothetical protein